MRSVRDDYFRRLLRDAEAQGCRVERTAGGHIKVMLPNGGMVVTAGSPSDKRGMKNFESALKRNGIVKLEKKQPREVPDGSENRDRAEYRKQ